MGAGTRICILAGGGLESRAGGVGTLLRYWLAEWSRTPTAPRPWVLDTRGPGGALSGLLRATLATIALAAGCLSGRVRLVHAHMTTRGSVVRKSFYCTLAHWFGVPSIIHMHGADFWPFYRRLHPFWQRRLRAVLARAACVIVLGQTWRDLAIVEFALPPEKVRLLRNGVPAMDPALASARRDRPAAPPQLLFLGRMGDRKGVPELLAALGCTALRTREWHAVLAGDGEVRRFQCMCRLHGLAQRLEVRGWVSQRAASHLLAAADILVLPSHHEALPLVVLEAMAAGVAVITTPVGAIPEFLSNHETAILVPPGDVPALAYAIAELIDDPAQRARLAAAGKVVFDGQFDVRLSAVAMLEIYKGIGDPARRSAAAVGARGMVR